MRYIRSHVADILALYNGSLPLTHFLKQYFKQNTKLGGRDRKLISEMVYAYFRFAKAISAPDTETRTDIALLLLDTRNRHAITMAGERWSSFFGQPLAARLAAIKAAGFSVDMELLLPAAIPFSRGIDRGDWLSSMGRQPRLFLRLQPGRQQQVYRRLEAASIAFDRCNAHCISLDNGVAADQVLDPDSYRVQDLSSQQTAQYFGAVAGDRCWDCCSGAGGKSLLLMEQQPKIKLTVSDIRSSILENLSERFRRYRYPLPRRVVLSAADAAQTAQKLGEQRFDRILCDVPCSGAGTWARTPEQLYFFDPAGLPAFAERQREIAANVVRYLKPGGSLIYITCSVFAAENEHVVTHLLDTCKDLQLEQMQLINGLGQGADCMFVAIIKKAGTS